MATCPICRRPIEWEGNTFRPFCSERCQLVDLHGWFDERYRFPFDEAKEMEMPGDGPQSSTSERDDLS